MPPRKHSLLTQEQIQQTYFELGMSMPKMALHFEVPYSLVRASFKKHGLSWRSKSEARAGRPWDEETKIKISRSRTGSKDTPDVAAAKRAVLKQHWGWNKGLTAETDPRIANLRASVRRACRTPEHRAKLSRMKAEQIEAGGYWDRGFVETTKSGKLYFMSSWERRRWLNLDQDSNVTAFQRHPCRIPYTWKGHHHLYLPDVLITYKDDTVLLEEIKPRRIVEDARVKQNKMAAKLAAGEAYAERQGWGWRFCSFDEGDLCFFS